MLPFVIVIYIKTQIEEICLRSLGYPEAYSIIYLCLKFHIYFLLVVADDTRDNWWFFLVFGL